MKPPMFISRDPLFEEKPWMSGYAYCSNSPVNRVDPSGMTDNPIFDIEGNFLGTDDKGIQGEAIVMKKENFQQSMSHEEAMKQGTTMENLPKVIHPDIFNKIDNQMESFPNRPDWDGKITLSEANDWYKNGNGQPLFSDLSKLDLSSIQRSDFDKNKDYTYFNLLFKGNKEDGLVYGNIGLKYIENEQVKSLYDDYDFDMKPWNSFKNIIRNIETKLGAWKAGNGTGFRIHFYGIGRIGN
jgi:hypothetical protein